MRCVEDECRQKTTEEGKGWSSVVVLRFATTCRSQEGQWGCAGTNNQLVGGRQQASLRHTSSSVKGIPTSSGAECRRMQSPRFSRKPGRAESWTLARGGICLQEWPGKQRLGEPVLCPAPPCFVSASVTRDLCRHFALHHLQLGLHQWCRHPDDQNSSWKEG